MKRSFASSRSCLPFLIAAAGLLPASFPAWAATDTWNGGATPNGNWSNPTNWSGVTPALTGDNLLFTGSVQSSSTNDLVGSAGWVQLNPSVPFTLFGNSLKLSSGLTNSAQNNFWNIGLTNMVNQNFDVAANTTLTIGTNISGTATFTIAKTSAGTLVLGGSGDDTSMQATVNGGTLILSKDSSGSALHALGGTTETVNSGGLLQLSGSGGDQISDTSAVVVNSGGAFDLNGQTEMVKSLTISGTGLNGTAALTNSSPNTAVLSFNDGTARSSGLGSAATIGGLGNIIIAGVTPFGQSTSQTLTKVGNNTLILTNGSGQDNHDLTIVVNSGTVVLAKPVAPSGAHCTGALTVNSGGTAQLGGSGGYQIYQGASPVVNSGGVIDLNGQPQFFTTAAGLTVSGTGINNSGVLINNNTATDAQLIGSGASAVTLAADSALGGSGNLFISGVISGSGKALTKVGAGTLTFSNAETYSGNTTISTGALALTGSGAVANSPVLTVATGAMFDVSGVNYSLGANQTLGGNGTINGTVTAAAGNITPGTATALGTLTFNNNLAVTSTIFTIGFDATGSNHSQVNVTGNLINNGLVTIKLNFHGLQPGTYTLLTYSSLGGSGSFQLGSAYPNVTLNPPGANALTITVGAGGSSGNASLVWKGDGLANVWDLNAANWAFLGGNVAFTEGDTATFDDTGSTNPAINLTTALTPASVTVNSANTYIFSGNGSLGGTMSLTKNGAGTLVLATANSYTGNTTVSAGMLQLGNGGTTGDVGNSATITLARGGAGADGSGAALTVNETGSPVFTNGISLASGNQGIVVDAGQTATFNGPISGAGQLWVTGPGTLVIGDNNTFTAGVVIDNATLGALQINAVSALNGGRIYFGKPSGGTLIYTGTNADGSTLAGASFFQGAAAHVVSIANPATTLTINTNMQGSGIFVKAGPGTLALGATNTYVCTTIVSNGTLALVGSAAVPTTPSITVVSNATFDVSAATGFSLVAGQSLGGNGSINGNVNAANGTIIPGLIATNPANSTFGMLTFSNNLTVNGALLSFGFSHDATVTNDQVQVLGNLENDGATLIALNYGSLNAGTYTLITYGSLTGSGTFALNGIYPNTTLNVGATSVTLTVGSGGARIGNLVWKGDGVANNWDVQTTQNWLNQLIPDVFFQGDTVTFDDTGSTNPAINLTTTLSPNSVTVNSSNTYTFSGTGQLSGQMNLTKSGTGTLVLAAANNYTGTTTVNAGMLQLGNSGTKGGIASGTINLVGAGAVVNGINNVGLAVNLAGATVFTNGLAFATGNQSVFVNAGQTAIFTGPLSGPGQLWVTGPGTMIISNTGNSYTSSNGAVLANNAAVLQIDSINEFNGLPIFFGHGGGTLKYTGPSADGSGMLANSDIFQGNTNVINIANAATTLTVTGPMGGSAANTAYVVKAGPGTLVFNTTNTCAAATVVSNGALFINGQLPSSLVNVFAGGKLGGSGQINTVTTIQPGGIIQGGDTNYSGILTIVNTLNLGVDNYSVTHSQFNVTDGGTLFPRAVNITGTNIVDIQDTNLVVGAYYPLIYYGSITYGPNATFQLGTIPPGVTAQVQDVGGEIDLIVTSVLPPPPTFGGVTTLPDHNFELSFSGPAGQGYTILTSTNLALPLSEWTPVGTGTFDSNEATFDDLDATNHPQRFYLITSP